MAYLGLTNAVNAAESLFDAVGIPRKVVVNHQVRSLQVYAFTGGVCGQQDLHPWVVSEGLLCGVAVFTPHATMNDNYGFFPPHQT